MKKILALVVTIASLFIVFNVGSAKKAVQRTNPCFKKCNVEYNKCVASTKKLKKAERIAKIKECKKQKADCLKACKAKQPVKATKKVPAKLKAKKEMKKVVKKETEETDEEKDDSMSDEESN